MTKNIVKGTRKKIMTRLGGQNSLEKGKKSKKRGLHLEHHQQQNKIQIIEYFFGSRSRVFVDVFFLIVSVMFSP